MTASAAIFWFNWQQALQNTPFRFSEIAPAQACLQKAAPRRASIVFAPLPFAGVEDSTTIR
jgi:hypothetical protein